MKKTIIATLLAGLVGAAGAQVQVSGKVSQFVDSTTAAGNTKTSMVTDPTSNFAIAARENLPGGLIARTRIETSLRGNNIDGAGTKLGDRQSTVGIAHKFGSVDIGRNVHSHFLAITTNDAFGTLYGSVAGDVHNLRGLRIGDAVFVNATPVKGVNLAYERTLNDPVQDATVWAISGTFKGITGTVARWGQGAERSTVLGVNGKLAGATLSWVHSDDQGTVASKGDTFGATYRVANVTAKASYGRTNNSLSAYAVGADYHMSARTSINLAYRNVNAAGTAFDVRGVGVGLTHTF